LSDWSGEKKPTTTMFNTAIIDQFVNAPTLHNLMLDLTNSQTTIELLLRDFTAYVKDKTKKLTKVQRQRDELVKKLKIHDDHLDDLFDRGMFYSKEYKKTLAKIHKTRAIIKARNARIDELTAKVDTRLNNRYLERIGSVVRDTIGKYNTEKVRPVMETIMACIAHIFEHIHDTYKQHYRYISNTIDFINEIVKNN